MNRRPVSTLLPACVLALAALACSDQGPEADDLRDEIARNRTLWVSVGPSTYVYDVRHNCFCGIEAVGPVRVRVENGQVVERTYVDTGATVDTAFAEVFPSVSGLFDVLDRALDRAAADIQVTWDPDTGAPTEFFIDYLAQAVDEEEGYVIVDGPRTTP